MNKQMRLALIGSLMLASFGVTQLLGQGTTATVQGMAADASSACVPDAAVAITSVKTTATETVNTDPQGRYLPSNVALGEYEIRASQSGFANAVCTGITLTVGSKDAIDFVLRVEQPTETITLRSGKKH